MTGFGDIGKEAAARITAAQQQAAANAQKTAQPTDTSTFDPRESLGKRIQQYEDRLDQLSADEPTTNDNGEHDEWAAQVKLYGDLLNTAYQRYGQNKDSSQQDFSNRVAEQQQKIAYDQTNLQRASDDINRFLSGQQESHQRAQVGLQATEDRMKYGTSGGKTAFSAGDLGDVFKTWGSILGIDNNAPLIKYPGFTNMDPMGDIAKMDAANGTSGAIPQVPSLVSGAPDLGPTSSPTDSLVTQNAAASPFVNPSADVLAQRATGQIPQQGPGSLLGYQGQNFIVRPTSPIGPSPSIVQRTQQGLQQQKDRWGRVISGQ